MYWAIGIGLSLVRRNTCPHPPPMHIVTLEWERGERIFTVTPLPSHPTLQAGNVLINLGYNILKLGHDRMQQRAVAIYASQAKIQPDLGYNDDDKDDNDDDDDHDHKGNFPSLITNESPVILVRRAQVEGLLPSSTRQPIWLLGVATTLLGNICTFASSAFAPVSILAALGAVQFVANVFFNAVLLKEPPTRATVASTMAIVTGCVLMVVFGPRDSRTYTADELQRLHQQLAWVIYLPLTCFFALVSYGLYRRGDWKAKVEGRKGWAKISPLAFGLYAGFIGSLTMIFSKSISSLLRETSGGNNQVRMYSLGHPYGDVLCGFP